MTDEERKALAERLRTSEGSYQIGELEGWSGK
jgi:hypothetical protein